jgi:hypothetical protein
LFLKNFDNGGLGKEIWREALGEEEAVQRIRGGTSSSLGVVKYFSLWFLDYVG